MDDISEDPFARIEATAKHHADLRDHARRRADAMSMDNAVTRRRETMKCYDRLSGERFEAEDERGIREYLSEALCAGQIAAYEVETDTGEVYEGEVTG